MKTLRKCGWKEIEIGEVFAINACWTVACKLSKDKIKVLATDYTAWDGDIVGDEFVLTEHSKLKGYSGKGLNFADEDGFVPYCVAPQKFYMSILDKLYKLSLEIQGLWREE